MSLRHTPAALALVAVFFFGSSLWAEEINFYFKTSPQLDLVYPYSDPVTLTVLVTGGGGKAVAQGRVSIRLDAPESGRFFSTDFPWVEGSRLLAMNLPLRQGKAEWKYVFPIRGEYRLAVEYQALDGHEASRSFAFRISERRQKWWLVGTFSLALFAVGVVAGRVFTSRSNPGRKIGACLLLSLGSWMPMTGSALAQELEGGPYFGWLEIDPPTVGKPSALRWRLAGGKRADGRSVLLTLTIYHLEKRKQVFAVERIPVPGQFAVDFQFTDGADYRVSAIAQITGRQMVRTEQNISVTGVEPPPRAMIPAIGFFLGLIALGLVAGRWIRRGPLS